VRVEPARPPFSSIHAHGLLRVAIAIPEVRVADPTFNAERTIELVRRAAQRGASLVLFPELGLSSYSAEDLFHQGALLDEARAAAERVVRATVGLAPVVVVGLPWLAEGRLYNCAAVIHAGAVLGLVPKSYLPNYREFYEKRQFTSGLDAISGTTRWGGAELPFGSDLVFEARGHPDFRLHVEICEDLWVPLPPSTWAALGGATVLANLSASNVTIAKADYRRALCATQSAKCLAAYLYVAAGRGESTTDLAWDGHAMVWENHRLLAESERFSAGPQLVVADVDLDRLVQERMRMTSFNDCAGRHSAPVRALRRVRFAYAPPREATGLERSIERFPYVPSDPERLEERCREAYRIQVAGLEQRLVATGIERIVIGVSGGLDSTQALVVAVRTCDLLGLPRRNVLGYSLPGFATSERTRQNARRLMDALGVSSEEIDIRPACERMLCAIGHPWAAGRPVYDLTFENVQAGERTSHLFRLANLHGALVLGTSDLSELALGWTTYGVGDQMSHYSVNASVPKTLIQHLVRWTMRSGELGEQARDVLASILETRISPELVPGPVGDDPAQASEETIGPYELQDFNLYFASRFGFRPSKIAFLAWHAWGDRGRGRWPAEIPEADRREYTLAEIKRWLEVFLRRFFAASQFKRSAMPNSPKVGSGGSLSPRADWRAPSDSGAEPWLRELAEHVPPEA
jgi:NAD+ synthase (glutamine-hydrolysing)